MSESDAGGGPQEQESGFWSITQPGIPLFMNVTLTIRPEHRDEFLAALREVLPAARSEPSCVFLHAGQSAADPDVFVLSEGWRDLVEYRDVVLGRPYFQTYLRISESAYAQPRLVTALTPILEDL